MKALRILIEPFEYITVTDCKFHKRVNEHGVATIIGFIDDSMEDIYLNMSIENLPVNVSIEDEYGQAEPFFFGLLDSLNIINDNGLLIMELKLYSYTILMDLQEQTYTFQDENMLYDELIEEITKEYNNTNFVMTEGSGEPLKDLIVQYKETDWEFCKRMASHFNTIIVPQFKQEGVKFYFGIPHSKNSDDLYSIGFDLQKRLGEHLYKLDNKVEDISENDSIVYEIAERKIWDIGDSITLNGNQLFVFEIYSVWHKQELIHTYYLKTKDGFKVPFVYNEKIIGASLDGKIIKVSHDVVKAHLTVDEKQEEDKAKWFDYSTVYSSPDKSGWYTMPEINDDIRLYFPTEKEKHGYVVNSIHWDNEITPPNRRIIPNNKSLSNKYQKEIELSEDMIKITCDDNITISIIDEVGIIVESDKNISLNAAENISIFSMEDKIKVIAKNGILLKQNDVETTLHDKLSITGSQVRIELN